MRNRQQFLDEMSLDVGGIFGARAPRIAERSASVGAIARPERSNVDRRSSGEACASDVFGKHVPKKLPGCVCAIDSGSAQSELDRVNKLKSNFLVAASRELGRPMHALALLLPSIERHIATNPRAIKTIDVMQQAIGGLNGLLGAMLEIFYLDADLIKPRLQTVDVGVMLRRLSTRYAEKASLLGPQFRAFAPQAFAFSDSYLLKTTLCCLIENALRFTSSGGVLVGVRRRDDGVRIDVIDTGVGVPTERQSEIFEEFVQFENPDRRNEKGAGLGLAIASRQATLLGASIEIRSHPGRGSRFSLWLPTNSATGNFDQTDKVDGEGPLRVLIVEDDAILRFGLERLVEQWGYDTFAATDAEDALKHLADDQMCFDAIITDYHLGSCMTGVQMVKELERRAGRRFPALILTGGTGEESLVEIAASGIAVAHKPVSAEELEFRFSKLLSASNAQRLSHSAAS